MSFVEVRKAVDDALEARNKHLDLKTVDILRELARVALVDIGEAFDDAGRLKPLKDIPVDVRRAIAGIESFEEYEGTGKDRRATGEVRKVKFWDKPKALELLGKHHKLFTEVHEHKGTVTLESLVRQAAGETPDEEK